MIKKDYAGLRNKEKVLEVLRMSKYDPLWKYLKENKKENYKLSYEEIKEILGFEIDITTKSIPSMSPRLSYSIYCYCSTICSIFTI